MTVGFGAATTSSQSPRNNSSRGGGVPLTLMLAPAFSLLSLSPSVFCAPSLARSLDSAFRGSHLMSSPRRCWHVCMIVVLVLLLMLVLVLVLVLVLIDLPP
jgi:hypothetical protein